MRRLELLIEDSRRETENEDFGDNVGISDEEFIRYANDAQDRLQSLIYTKYQDVFAKEKDVSTTASVQAYQLPFDTYLDNAILKVRYKDTSTSSHFYDIEKVSLHELNSNYDGFPGKYVRLDGSIHLLPKPSVSGVLKINYIRRLDNIDKRRAIISAITISGTSLTSLTLDTSGVVFDIEAMSKYNRFCIVGRDGTQKMRNIEYDVVSDSTGVVTITGGSFTFEGGESGAVNDYIVLGKDNANISELPDVCERYLIAYMNWKVLKRDSSNDAAEMAEELKALEEDILSSYSEVDADITYIPILDTNFIDE